MFKVGVLVVAVLDPLSDSMMICRKNMPPRVLFEGDVLTLPEVLPGFELPIARFFE
jgi:Uma2 family endonuclease